MTAEADAAAGGGPPAKRMADAKKEQPKLTKRQRRKKVNETHKWPQHPKIQDMEVRNKAYIRVAGLGSSSKKRETMDPALDLLSPEVKFCRLLGSTDQRKRHAAVQKLKAYLKARCDIHNENGGISEMDLLKLWKGLWYTLYMADKVPVQDELSKHLTQLLWCVAGTEEEDEYAGQAYMEMCEQEECDDDCHDASDVPEVTLEEVVNTLRDADNDDDDCEGSSSEDDQERSEHESNENESEEEQVESEGEDEGEEIDNSEIPHCRGAHLASLFIRTFFRTVKREWGKMDKYRVDKFYTLSRMYIHEIFRYMALRHWNLGIIRLFNDAIFEEVLDQKPNGLRYHLIDIVLDELAKVNAKAPMPLTEATFLDALEPYFAMCQTGAGGDDSVQARALERVVEKFLDKYSVISQVALKEMDECGNNNDTKEPIFDQVHVASVAQFIFDVASDPATTDRYRKSLYDMHKAFMRRLKNVGKDVQLNETEQIDERVEMEDEDQDFEAGLVEQAGGTASSVEENSSDEKEEIAVARCKKENKSQKRKEVHELDPSEKDHVELQTLSTKRKRKEHSQKAQKAQHDSDNDETVTISLSEQKKAKNKDMISKRQKVKAEAGEKITAPKTASSDKRVKWLPNNKSKSYKASMKALLTASPPLTSKVTPEKSILLNKGEVRRVGKIAKKGRKKAVNYF